MEELLPVLDSLEQGMQHDKALAIIYGQLSTILKKRGLQKIKIEKGLKFDHDKMECMLQEKCVGAEDDTVAKILIAGYELNGKILRPAKVSVNVLEKNTQNEEKK
jgi:molecular chaperone GrpE